MSIETKPWNPTYSVADTRVSFMRSVYLWMTGGVLLTALVASFMGDNPEMVITLVRTPVLFYGLIIAQLAAVITLSAAVNRLSVAAATSIYIAYAALTGVTLSTLFMIYTRDSIAGVFLTTACGFGGLSLLGFTTKKDLGPVGTFCSMALFGMIGWALLSFFFPSLMGGEAQLAYSLIGVVVFAGLTAYDTQKIKNLGIRAGFGYGAVASEGERKAAIFGALTLYLDFINLFLMLLRLMGDRRR